MSIIKILSEDVITKIAAGEVVERPASVVKELVENAIDAKASQIDVTIENGGLKLIQVVDNGSGMGREDLQLSVLPHATSKLIQLEDLMSIQSLGFRGEALSSISSVSTFSIASRQLGEDLGNRLRVESEGEFVLEGAGMPVGTVVRVEDLFHNVPARRKFLKSTATEFKAIADMVSSLALAHPEIGFTLTHNGREYLTLLSTGFEERLQAVLGEESVTRLLPVSLSHPHLEISGFVSRPELTTIRPEKQFLYVNNRRIKDAYLNAAVKKAYGTLLMPRSYPLFILFISLPSEMVDVNVHPRKDEVAFVNRGAVFGSVVGAVGEALFRVDLTYGHIGEVSPGPNRGSWGNPPSPRLGLGFGAASEGNWGDWGKRGTFEVRRTLVWDKFPEGEVDSWEILQIHNTYLVQQTDSGLVLVDQHAAHERVLYEKFLQDFQERKGRSESQKLLVPMELRLAKSQMEILGEFREVLEGIGFSFDGGLVTGVPLVLAQKDIQAVLTQFLEDLSEEGGIMREVDDDNLRALTFLSCRSAVKAGDYLPLEERRALLKSLGECEVEYTCPHGRPVSIEISLRDLEKMFKRVV